MWRVSVSSGVVYTVAASDLPAFVAVLASNKVEFSVRRVEPGGGGAV